MHRLIRVAKRPRLPDDGDILRTSIPPKKLRPDVQAYRVKKKNNKKKQKTTTQKGGQESTHLPPAPDYMKPDGSSGSAVDLDPTVGRVPLTSQQAQRIALYVQNRKQGQSPQEDGRR